MPHSNLFQPTRFGTISAANRLVTAPMTRISGNPDGTIGPLMTDYYANFARGGFGVVITEGIYTDEAYSQGYINQPGIATDAQRDSWKPLVKEVQSLDSKIIMQLMHAGALTQFNAYKDVAKGPSAVQPGGEKMPFYHGTGPYSTPQAMDEKDIEQVIEGFVLSADRARDAGFDGVEIHGANGYLLDQFFTKHTNERTDKYGGTVANRILLTCEIITAVRQTVGPDFVVGVRISQGKVNDFKHKWSGGVEDAAIVFKALADAGADYIHTTEFEADKPAFGEGDTLASLAGKHAGLPVIANGAMTDPIRASGLLDNGDADFIAIAKGALANSDWPNLVRQNEPLKEFDFGMLSPYADLESALSFQSQNYSK